MGHVWRFGYGSNIGLKNLRDKKDLNPTRCVAGTIAGWELYFKIGYAPYVEPAWASIRTHPDGDAGQLHGTAFLISEEEASGLDQQERSYNALLSRFVAYDGEVIEVGLYVNKSGTQGGEEALPSLRYLRLIQNGAREAGLSAEWIHRVDSVPHYVTPPDVRGQTEAWMAEFAADPARKDELWTSEELSKYDGSDPAFPAHVSVMGYIAKINLERGRYFAAWKGHDITRRNLLQFNGENHKKNDIQFDQPGFRPLPKLACCSDEEKEVLFQNLDSLLHQGGTIVARLKDFVDDQNGS